MKLICLLIYCCSCLALTLFKGAAQRAEALRISSIEVPAAVMNGSQATLVCNYDLQADQLYSVKWYKNYVEFYRFQPQQGGAEEGTKQEFELDGINLNLSRSNSTHVYLKQTNLATEGTFKCEVSADSPSFATIATERQMKIYVLPKQKLAIIDNVAANNQLLAGELQAAKQTQLNTYNINDVLNLTCISGASKPAAQLSWLINDSPVGEASKWLSRSSFKQPGSELAESRLTLTFRLQPLHLNNANSVRDSAHFAQLRFQSLKLRCVARLSVEFSAQTEVVLAGGAKFSRNGNKKQQQSTSASASASAAPWQMRSRGELAESSSAQSWNQSQSAAAAEPLYRWPRPAAQPTNRASSSRRTAVQQQSELSDPWPDLETHEGGGRRLSVWSARQLRAQAEHIDQLLKFARPNQLDKPSITSRFSVAMSGQPEQPREETELDETRDFELDDLVEFACLSRIEPVESGANVARKVNLKWFINNYEISTTHVNTFDGAKYYNDKRRLPYESNRSIRVVSSERKLTQRSATATESSPSNVESTGDIIEGDSLAAEERKAPTQAQEGDEREKKLWVEFTRSLFQAKELNLKCRTLVEQTIIEYESKLIVSVPTNPQFIQATAEHRAQQQSGPSVTRNQHRFKHAGNNQQHRGRYSLSRQQQTQAQNSSVKNVKPNQLLLLPTIIIQMSFLLLFNNLARDRRRIITVF